MCWLFGLFSLFLAVYDLIQFPFAFIQCECTNSSLIQRVQAISFDLSQHWLNSHNFYCDHFLSAIINGFIKCIEPKWLFATLCSCPQNGHTKSQFSNAFKCFFDYMIASKFHTDNQFHNHDMNARKKKEMEIKLDQYKLMNKMLMTRH